MIRKWCLSLVLPLLLLLAQQGALWHEIGHLQGAGSGQTQAPAHRHGPGDKLCQTCLAYASMAAFAQPAVLPLALLAAAEVAPIGASVATLAADAPAPRSRGPPPAL